MNLKKVRPAFVLFLTINFFSLTSLSYLNAKNFNQKPSVQKKFLIPPPPKIEYFSLGYNESLSDLLWIRLIQDLTSCGKKRVKRSELTKWLLEKEDHQMSQLKTHKAENEKRELSSLVSKAQDEVSTICLMGWMYHMLDAITKLTPKYSIAYSTGASSLSVLGEDPWGAKLIFDRGVKNFPKDWRILYRAAYHYLYELFDTNKASKLLKQAGENGAPTWVFSLASRLNTKEGQLRLALTVLKNFKQGLRDKTQKEKVQKKIDFIKEQFSKNPSQKETSL